MLWEQLDRVEVWLVLRHEWVCGMGSQTMNSVSGLKPELVCLQSREIIGNTQTGCELGG